MNSLGLAGHSSCAACHLAETRTKVVEGYGNTDSPLCFVGEAPGAEEDQAGQPFIGRAGKLLRDIVDSMPQMQSDKYFYTNIYHCRPPKNDIAKASGSICPSIWLASELKSLNKLKVVIATGKTACDFFRPDDTDMPMRWHQAKDTWDERGFWVVGMYHPAYALRQGVAEGQRDGNIALVSMVASLQRAAYYLIASGWQGDGGPDIIEALEEGAV